MGVKEKALTAASSIASGDFLRMVTSAGAARKIDYSKLAKAIVEEYNGSTIAGSAQTLKAALDSLNSKTKEYSIPDNSDLDDYTTNGAYVSGTNANAQSLQNCPTTTSFILKVSRTGTIQEIDDGYFLFVRKKTSTGWQPWYKFTGTRVDN